MKSFAVVAAAAGLAAAQSTSITSTASQGATYSFTSISPKQTNPAGCSSSYDGQFQISVVNVTQSHSKRADTALTCTLDNGLLKDAAGRIGYIASNYQFQFDFGGQAGEVYTTGWSACSNGTLALGGSAIFYQCLSGSFYNLYSQSQGAQCVPIYIDILGGAQSSAPVASQQGDGQVTATPRSSQAVSQITDGQIQATTSPVAISQISDGQIQATTATPAAPITQISDGQIQASTGTARPVTQIGDGQIQASTGVASSMTVSRAPVTQIGDGQIQASTGTGRPITQISDGQIQAPTNGTRPSAATATVQAYTGAAAMPTAQLMAVAAGALAMLAL